MTTPATHQRSFLPLLAALGYFAAMLYFGLAWDRFYTSTGYKGDNYFYCLKVAFFLTQGFYVLSWVLQRKLPLLAVFAAPLLLGILCVPLTFALVGIFGINDAHYRDITTYCVAYGLLSAVLPLVGWLRQRRARG